MAPVLRDWRTPHEPPYQDLDDDDLQTLWEQHRKNLGILEGQAALYGMTPPLDIINNMSFTKDKVTLLKDEFAQRRLDPQNIDPNRNIGRQLYYAIPLEDEQCSLLVQLADVAQNTPSERRQRFQVYRAEGAYLSMIFHQGIKDQINAYRGDIDVLSKEGLLNTQEMPSSLEFDVTPRGLAYVDYMKG